MKRIFELIVTLYLEVMAHLKKMSEYSSLRNVAVVLVVVIQEFVLYRNTFFLLLDLQLLVITWKILRCIVKNLQPFSYTFTTKN